MTIGSPAPAIVHLCICCETTYTGDPICHWCERTGCDELENVGRLCPRKAKPALGVSRPSGRN